LCSSGMQSLTKRHEIAFENQTGWFSVAKNAQLTEGIGTLVV